MDARAHGRNVGSEWDGPLAEFSALREEIQARVQAQNQVLSLQLTVTAAIFGFSMSRQNMTTLLLLVPFTSYLLCGRLASHHFGTVKAAQYISEELSKQVPGGLRWEQWLRRSRKGPSLLGSTLPLLLTFVGASVLALAWVGWYIYAHGDADTIPRAGLIALWILGFIPAALSAWLVLQMDGRTSAGLRKKAAKSR
ncbi:hypothetical protein [Micromonospora sp. RTGN7]|uniref:hypothetical protein n=1 Tax=Micromonospora sp. RTGN7 TaxID=3016526 RepID=UPI0029FF3194|nr:hypothetical protein [Micromonospora sp. RTGN7]